VKVSPTCAAGAGAAKDRVVADTGAASIASTIPHRQVSFVISFLLGWNAVR
jgi:hypothetical protein